MIRDCNFCGRDHERTKTACPAWGKQCTLCKKMNHFKVKCVRARSGVRSLVAEHDQSESEQVWYSGRQVQIYTIQQVAQINLFDEQAITLKVRDHHYIRFQICNVLPLYVYKVATGDEPLSRVEPSRVRLMGFGQRNEKSVGRVNMKVWREKNIGRKLISDAYILKYELVEGTNFHSILGSAACRGLDLLEIKDSDAINPVGHRKMCMPRVDRQQIKSQLRRVSGNNILRHFVRG